MLQNIFDIYRCVTAGNSTFTLLNTDKDSRITLKFKRTRKNRDNINEPIFVSVLNGSDNNSDYQFIGTIFNNSDGFKYKHSPKTSIGSESISAKSAKWMVNKINSGQNMPDNVEFYHSGNCAKCGRKLTTPESIKNGLGPICFNR